MGKGRRKGALPKVTTCGKCGWKGTIYTYDDGYGIFNICSNCHARHEIGASFQSLAAQFATSEVKRHGKTKDRV